MAKLFGSWLQFIIGARRRRCSILFLHHRRNNGRAVKAA
jgi:hypothetical protein